jgi:CBS domain-containing protein
MTTVSQLLREKPAQVWSISSQATVYEALQLMAEKEIGAVVVVDEEKVMGIFSERDYARKVILRGLSSRETRVEELMTRRVYYAYPEESMEDLMTLMTAKRIRHLPVLDDGRLVGVISIGDVVKTVIVDHEFTIREMEKYITGSAGSLR